MLHLEDPKLQYTLMWWAQLQASKTEHTENHHWDISIEGSDLTSHAKEATTAL